MSRHMNVPALAGSLSALYEQLKMPPTTSYTTLFSS
jgi:hypothetical protein